MAPDPKQRKLIKPALIAVITLLVVGVGAWFAWRALRAPSGRPNVIIISIDTLRADHLGCYGHPGGITPNIDRFAGEAVRFENVVSAVPLTLPSHSTMLTGTTPVYHGVHKNESYQLASSNVTLAEQLQASGYRTGAIVSSFILDTQFGLTQGFETYNDVFPISMDGARFSERKGEATSQLAIEWLQQRGQDESFFLFLHYYDPHVEYEPPEPFASRWPGRPYAGEVAYTDHCIGQVLEKLKELDLYDNSIIIVTSDHGEMLDEHGEKTHGYFIYESAIKVPLIIKPAGGQSQPREVASLAGLVDIVPTICDLLGISPPPVSQGQSLTPCLQGDPVATAERYLYCESTMAQNYDANPLLGLVGAQWKYIETNRSELYDLIADPGETTNLIESHGNEARILSDVLHQALLDTSGQSDDGQVTLDASARSRLESLGYVSVGEQGQLILDSEKDDPKDLLEYHSQLMEAMTALRPGRPLAEHVVTTRRLVAQRPRVIVARWVLAKMLTATGDYSEALGHYDDLIEMRPDDAVIYGQRGYVREKLGDEEGANADYVRAIELQSDEVGTRMQQGRLLAKQGRFQEALVHINEVIRLDPTMRGVWYVRGTIHTHLGDLDRAVADLDEAIRRDPNHVGAYMNRGGVRAQRGDLRGAIADWSRVTQLKPDAYGAYVNVAMAKQQLGDKTGAIAELERCLGSMPADQTESRQRIQDMISQIRQAP